MKRLAIGKRRNSLSILRVRRAPGHTRHHGLLTAGWMVYPCALGEGGVSVFKREGDGKTPIGRFAVMGLYLHHAKSRQFWPSGIMSRARTIQPDMGWCDDPSSGNYNREVKLPSKDRHEKLLRDDGLYDIVFVIDWNMKPRVRGAGSAIFMHIARSGYKPTEGCIAVDRRTIQKLATKLAADAKIVVYP